MDGHSYSQHKACNCVIHGWQWIVYGTIGHICPNCTQTILNDPNLVAIFSARLYTITAELTLDIAHSTSLCLAFLASIQQGKALPDYAYHATGNIPEAPELGTPGYIRDKFVGSQWCSLKRGSTVDATRIQKLTKLGYLVLVSCNHNLGVPACYAEGSNCLRLSGLCSLI